MVSCGIQQYSVLERGIRGISYGIQYTVDGSIGMSLTYRNYSILSKTLFGLSYCTTSRIHGMILKYKKYSVIYANFIRSVNTSVSVEIWHTIISGPCDKFILSFHTEYSCILESLTHSNIRSCRELYPVCSYRIQLYPWESESQQYPVLSGTLSSLILIIASQEVKHTSISSPADFILSVILNTAVSVGVGLTYSNIRSWRELYPVCHTEYSCIPGSKSDIQQYPVLARTISGLIPPMLSPLTILYQTPPFPLSNPGLYAFST